MSKVFNIFYIECPDKKMQEDSVLVDLLAEMQIDK